MVATAQVIVGDWARFGVGAGHTTIAAVDQLGRLLADYDIRSAPIRFGEPIAAEHDSGDADGLALRALTDEVMFEIVQLCGIYEYRDVYATRVAEDVPTAPARVTPMPLGQVA